MMENGTAIQRVADSVVEATCLLAVLALPLYFSILTGGYEPDKAVLVRTLACVAAAGMLVSLVAGWQTKRERRKEGSREVAKQGNGGTGESGTGDGVESHESRVASEGRGRTLGASNLLLVLATLVFVAYLVSTVLSIDSRLSLWGSEGRQQGLWTRAAYLIFLLAVATRFRTAQQMNRLISMLLLGSVPVVTYAFFQQFGHDVVGSSGSPDTKQWPVWSSFGQHVFFGSYLVLVMPFTLSRLAGTWGLGLGARSSGGAGKRGSRETGKPGNREAGKRGDAENGKPGDREAAKPGDAEAGRPGDGGTTGERGTLRRGLSGWIQRDRLIARLSKDREVWVAVGIVVFVGFSYVGALALGDHEVTLFAILPGLLAVYVVLGLLLQRISDSGAIEAIKPAAYAALLAGQILALAFTGARAAWIGALATVPVFGFLATRRMGRPDVARLILGATIVGSIFLLLLNIPNGPLQPLRTVHGLSRVANITDSGGAEGSAQGRLLLWQGVKKLMTSVPSMGSNWGGIGRDIVGYGPETMSWAFDATFPLKLRQVNSEILTWDRSHNIYLDYLIDSGFLGLLLLIGMLVTFFWRVLRLLSIVGSGVVRRPHKSGADPSTGHDARAWILIAVTAAMVGHLVDGFFSIETAVTFLLFWTMVGIVANPLFDSIPSLEVDANLGASPVIESLPASRLPLVPNSPLVGAFGVALVLILAGIILVTFTSSTDPTFLAVCWLLSILLGLAAITISLVPGELSLDVARIRWKRPVIGWVGIGLIALLVLDSQFRYQEAAIAERTGADYLGAGQAGGALPFLQQAVQANGYDAGYQTELAKSYFSLGGTRTDSTEPDFVPISNDARTIDTFRAESLGQDQLFQLANLSLSSARSLTPLDPDVYNNLGNLYLQWGKPAQAIAEYAQAENLSTNNPRYLDQEALAHLSAKDLTKAAQRARTALSLDNTFWLSHYTLALVDRQAGDHSGAKQEATLSLDLVGNYWPPPPASEIAQLQSLKAQG